MRVTRFNIGITVLLAVTLAQAGCTGTASNGNGAIVVATTTILGSVVEDIAQCGGGTAETLMPIGTDPHDFSASSEQVAHMAEARLVVANGLGLEGGLTDALTSAEAEGVKVIEVAALVGPIQFGGVRSDGSADAVSLDPHFWNDVSRMAAVAGLIGEELAEVTGVTAYAGCGEEVRGALLKTDQEVRSILASVSAERRVLVTDHDAFGYFAQAYDFEIAGVIVPGGSTLAGASSEELADLVNVIRLTRVPAIFSNIALSPALAETVAAEAGAKIEVVALYVGSLGPQGSGAATYSEMMITNARLIADALG
jgi:zinc/manganese transport system substrate-binding protein